MPAELLEESTTDLAPASELVQAIDALLERYGTGRSLISVDDVVDDLLDLRALADS